MKRAVQAKCRWTLYARIVATTMQTPSTAIALAERLGVTRNNMRKLLRRMADLGLVYVSAWERVGLRQMPAQVYAYGDLPCAPMPLNKRNGLPSRHAIVADSRPLRPRIELLTFARIVKAMSEPRTAEWLSEDSGAHRNAVYSLIRFMRGLSLVHIGDWHQRSAGGSPSAMYQMGADKDAPRPAVRSRREIEARWRAGRAAKDRMQFVNHALAANAAHFTESEAA